MNITELEQYLSGLEDLEHEDLHRLALYLDNVEYIPDTATIGANIERWIDNEQDAFYGIYDGEEEFAQEYFEQVGESISDLLVVDWQATYDYSFQYDFFNIEGYFWRNI